MRQRKLAAKFLALCPMGKASLVSAEMTRELMGSSVSAAMPSRS